MIVKVYILHEDQCGKENVDKMYDKMYDSMCKRN